MTTPKKKVKAVKAWGFKDENGVYPFAWKSRAWAKGFENDHRKVVRVLITEVRK